MSHVNAPFTIDARGRTALADRAAWVRSLIRHLLLTAPGERVNRPDFGSGLMQLVFAPSGDPVAAATQMTVRAALERHLEGLARVEDVEATSNEAELRVVVRYRLPGGASEELVVTQEVGA